MTPTPAQAAIATLIEMAQQGEIDPWDVQVIDVIDRFLQELGISHEIDSTYQQTHLPHSGQAFLWASMLVLLKADTLENLETEGEEDSLREGELLESQEYHRYNPLDLENQIRRRTSAPPPRKRRVTLQELIEQLEQISLELEKITPPPSSVKRPRPQSRREALRVITQLAHSENLTELATQLEEFFQLRLPHLAPERTCLELEELLTWWSQRGINSSEHSQDRVGVFWALLLLSSQSKVELSQEEFYQDLKIQVIL